LAGALPHLLRHAADAPGDQRAGDRPVSAERDLRRRGAQPRLRAAQPVHAPADAREGPGPLRRRDRDAAPGLAERAAAAGARAGLPHLRAEDRLRDGVPHLHPVPDPRHGRRVRPHLDGHDHAAARPHLAAVQADAVRARRRLERAHRLARAELPLTKEDRPHERRDGDRDRPERPRDDARARGAGAPLRPRRGPLRERLPGDDADQRGDAHLHPEDRRDGGRAPHLRAVDALAVDRLHDDALPEPADVRAVTMPIPDPTTFLLVLARIAGLVLAAPVFGHLLVPVRVRIGLAMTFAVALAPAVAPGTPDFASSWMLARALAVESATGVLLGLVAQLVFAGVQLGGQLAGIQMGFGVVNLIDPQTHAQVTVVSEWQNLLALLVFLALDVHHLLVSALLESFRTVPPGAIAISAGGIEG